MLLRVLYIIYYLLINELMYDVLNKYVSLLLVGVLCCVMYPYNTLTLGSTGSQCFTDVIIEIAHSVEKSLPVALSRLHIPLKTMHSQQICFKSFITCEN